MSDVAIQVENLSKRYRIGTKEVQHDTLMSAAMSWVRSPLDNFRRLRRLSAFQNGTQADVLWALQDVSFTVKHGEVIGIIGRNGAGKSTLLKILSRITPPTGGKITLNGRVASLLEVGTGFHPELTGRENVYLNGTVLGMTKSEVDRKFDEIVDFSGVEKFIDTPVKRYSSGMKVRLAFSVAAHLEPEILLVDEVLAVGDVAFQKKCLNKMGEVSQKGLTVFFVSHNMTSISSLTARCLLMDDGHLIQDGNTTQVIKQYLVQSGNSTANVSWEEDNRPGDEHFEFIQCFLGANGNQMEFLSNEKIPLTIKFFTKTSITGLRIGFDLLSDEGVLLFRAYHDDQDMDLSFFNEGVYETKCFLPADLLNQGNYFITLRAGIQAIKRICILEQALSFSVLNLAGNNSQYGGIRPGVLNPSLDWSINVLN